METAYQKWEKRRQERTGGHRPALSHRRKKGSVALGPREKRRMAQLAVCLALFLVVFIGKGVFPGKLAEVRETVLSAIQADTDFKAAFASLGRSISEGEPILDTLGGGLWRRGCHGAGRRGTGEHAPVPRPGRISQRLPRT